MCDIIKENIDYELVSKAVGSPVSDLDILAMNCYELLWIALNIAFLMGSSIIAGKSRAGNNIATVFRNMDRKDMFNIHDRCTVSDAIIFATQKVIENKDL